MGMNPSVMKEVSPMKRVQGLGIVAVALFLLIASTPSLVQAAGFGGSLGPPPQSGKGGPGGPGMGPGHGPGGPPDPIMGMAGMALRGLDLSPDQRQQIRELIHGARTGDLGTLARQFMDARRGLELLVWTPGSTEQQIADQGAIVTQAAMALEQARRVLAGSVLDVLTDEQRAQFAANLAREPRPPADRPDPAR
jgi:Spy/CpxP family protein refolding chaperone